MGNKTKFVLFSSGIIKIKQEFFGQVLINYNINDSEYKLINGGMRSGFD
jgi:hypothetical protein